MDIGNLANWGSRLGSTSGLGVVLWLLLFGSRVELSLGSTSTTGNGDLAEQRGSHKAFRLGGGLVDSSVNWNRDGPQPRMRRLGQAAGPLTISRDRWGNQGLKSSELREPVVEHGGRRTGERDAEMGRPPPGGRDGGRHRFSPGGSD